MPYAPDWEAANRATLAAPGPLWVALGDSMSQGIGASAFDRGWIGQLAESLPYRVLNLSVSGGRVRDVLDRQLPVLDGLDAPAALVTLMVGSNDLMQRTLRTRLPIDLPALPDRLPAGTVVANQPGTHAAALAINEMIDDAVTRRGLVLAEMRDPRTRHWSGKLAADRFHPDDRGYAGMAEIVGEALARRS